MEVVAAQPAPPAPPPATAMKPPPPATKSVSPEKPINGPLAALKQLVATADADARRAAQERRDRHFSMAAGRPATADAQRSAATTWEPLATSQWKPTFPQY